MSDLHRKTATRRPDCCLFCEKPVRDGDWRFSEKRSGGLGVCRVRPEDGVRVGSSVRQIGALVSGRHTSMANQLLQAFGGLLPSLGRRGVELLHQKLAKPLNQQCTVDPALRASRNVRQGLTGEARKVVGGEDRADHKLDVTAGRNKPLFVVDNMYRTCVKRPQHCLRRVDGRSCRGVDAVDRNLFLKRGVHFDDGAPEC